MLEPAIGELARSVKVIVDDKRGHSQARRAYQVTPARPARKACRTHSGQPPVAVDSGGPAEEFRECAIEGVSPLGTERGELLCARINGVEEAADMAGFFNGIAEASCISGTGAR